MRNPIQNCADEIETGPEGTVPVERSIETFRDFRDGEDKSKWWNQVEEITKITMNHHYSCACHTRSLPDQITAATGALNTFIAHMGLVIWCLDEDGGDIQHRDPFTKHIFGHDTNHLSGATTTILNMVFSACELYGCWTSLRVHCRVRTEASFAETMQGMGVLGVIRRIELIIHCFERNDKLKAIVETFRNEYRKWKALYPESSLDTYAFELRNKASRQTFAKMLLDGNIGGLDNLLDVDEFLFAATTFAKECKAALDLMIAEQEAAKSRR